MFLHRFGFSMESSRAERQDSSLWQNMIIRERAELTDSELKLAEKVIRQKAPGTYKLRTLMGRQVWRKIHGPTWFGIRFSASFDAGRFPALRRGTKRSNSWTYIIEDE
ncbi:hypothetical protein [Sphingobium cupriresistens]|uniref:hypothetical protein n=1 Tax=Sphingobium cupriresistens TaxID=1132417 RepID=UPI003BF55D99